jgi:hypothetical protein
MIKVESFRCYDCGRDVAPEKGPILVLRHNPEGAGVKRVKVCSKCQYKTQPQKKSKK